MKTEYTVLIGIRVYVFYDYFKAHDFAKYWKSKVSMGVKYRFIECVVA